MRRRRTAEAEDTRNGHERLGCTSKIRSPFDVRTIPRASQQPARVAWRLPERHVSECAVTRRSRVLRGMIDLLLHDSNRTLIAANERRLARRVPQREIRIPGPRTVAVGVLVLSLAGCSRDNGQKQSAGTAATSEALAATPGFARQSAPYTARTLDSIGRATGTVEIEGAPPADSVVQPTSDQAVCGVSITHRSLERRGNRAVGVVVWIDGIRSGKPLPLERRFEIANEHCLIAPELQAAIAGGTLNVQNLDAVEHRTRITRRATGELLATIRETDEGQVVPNEHVLTKAGVLELTCAAHPWTHAWIAVFDHPYFALTGTDGSFVIDSVPPGRYKVHAWHPRLGAMEQSLTIEAGKAAALTLRARAEP